MRHLTHTMSAAALALLAAFGAARPCAGAEMALGRTQLATREWVRSLLTAANVPVEEQLVADVATNVVTAADGTARTNLTFSSAWSCEELTNCVSISITASAPSLVLKEAKTETASMLRLVLMPFSLYAADPFEDGSWTLEVEIDGGTWTDTMGNVHLFDFSPALHFIGDDLPDMPDKTHVCSLDEDCNCVYKANKKPSDVADVPAEYLDLTDDEKARMNDPVNWIDTANWPKDHVNTIKAPGGTKTYYFVDDSSGNKVNLANVAKSDAWKLLVRKAVLEARIYLKRCEDAYRQSRVCDKENPQHDAAKCGAKTLGKCARCGAQFGADEGHDWFGTLAPTVHYCKCGARSERHTFGDGVLVSHVGDWGTYRRACEKCGYEETYQAALATCVEDEDYHVAAKEACGCLCGKYGAEGAASTEKAMHKWSKTKDANGSVPCLCLCGRYHDARSATDAKTECKGVCASCRKRPLQNGVDVGEVADSAHTPCEPSDGHCGCKCQYLTANGTSDAAYHIQKPGTCRCMGADGNGGAWHFPEPDSDCPEVCQYRNADGTRHLASKEKAREEGLGTAPSTVHAKVESGSCGCKCGDYTSANVSDWGGANFHNRHTSDSVCGCCCGKGTEADLGGVDGYHRGYGEWEVKSTEIRDGKVVTTWARKCQCGGHEQTKEEEGALTECDNAAGYHVAKFDTCGCLCGKYGAEGETHAEKAYHRWNRKDGETCLCDCGQWHKPNPPTTYQTNKREKCRGICATCARPIDGEGVNVAYAPASLHTPCEVSDARCGCWCGVVTSAVNDERFHPQKPNTCLCFGADGKGGRWHFPEPLGTCTKICAYTIDGKQHLAASKKEWTAALAEAKPTDHTKFDGSGRCGCQCNTYNNSNWSEWSSANFHVAAVTACGCQCGHATVSDLGGEDKYHRKTYVYDCDCICGSVCLGHVDKSSEGYCGPKGKCKVEKSKHHYPVTNPNGCPGVCHGECGASTNYANVSKHTQAANTCGCQCSKMDQYKDRSDFPFHGGSGDPACWCVYNHKHIPRPKQGCMDVCSVCGKGSHTFHDNKCGCVCGDKRTPHNYASDECTCYCGDETRDHEYGKPTESANGAYTCGTCGNTIQKRKKTYTCARCGETSVVEYEEGHASDCGKTEKDAPSSLPYCEKHKIWYSGDECPQCADSSGSGSDGGEGGGTGSTTTTTNVDDIL